MRKISFIIILFLVFSFTIIQGNTNRPQYLGLRFGPVLNFNKIYFDNDFHSHISSGFHVGFMREFNLGKHTSILGELNFEYTTQQIMRYHNTDSALFINENVLYSELPFYFRFKFGDKIQFISDLGVQLFSGGIPLQDKLEQMPDWESPKFDQWRKQLESRYRSIFNLSYGVGVCYHLPNQAKWSAMIRHTDRSNSPIFQSNQIAFSTTIYFKL